MRGAETLVKALEVNGLDLCFGLIGDLETEIAEYLRRSKIEFYGTRHEQAGAFMAGIYNRRIGKLSAFSLSTLGPGALNMIGGVANATQDRDPLIAISFQTPRNSFHRDTHQYIDLEGTYSGGATKKAFTISSVNEIPEIVGQAAYLAREERPGGVHISVPVDLLTENFEDRQIIPSELPEPKIPESSDVDKLLQLIQEAEFPIAIVGGGYQDNVRQQNLVDSLINPESIHFLLFKEKDLYLRIIHIL